MKKSLFIIVCSILLIIAPSLPLIAKADITDPVTTETIITTTDDANTTDYTTGAVVGTTTTYPDGVVTIYEEELPIGNSGTQVNFTDNSLVDTSLVSSCSSGGTGGIVTESATTTTDGVTTDGVTTECPDGRISYKYAYSYYTVGSKTIQKYNAGPQTNNTFLISLARGEQKTLDHEIEIYGSVSYSSTVSADIKKLINVELVNSVTGSVTFKYKTSTSYKGPEAPYNSRDYYGAVQFDLYSIAVKKYNVYYEYNGVIRVGSYIKYAGTSYVNQIKSPKKISYSKDFIE